MRLLDKFRATLAPPADPPPAAAPIATDVTLEKAEMHVRRFELALEQCEKGPEREAELRRNLDYWRAIQAAKELQP
jgi:hypothetical protein